MLSSEKNELLKGALGAHDILPHEAIYHLRKNTFASFSLMSFLVLALSLSVVFFLLDSNTFYQNQTLFGGLAWFVGQSCLLLLLRRGVAKPIIINASMLLAAIILNCTAWTSAGIVAIETPLLLLIPLIVLSTLGHKAGFVWFVLISANLLTMAFATRLGVEFQQPTFDISWFIASAVFLIVLLACTLGLIRILQIENIKLQKELSDLAEYHRLKGSQDGLTQLLNKESFKMMFERKKARARYEQKSMTMLVVDLNKFKQINDNFGHLVGDEVLQGIAHNLRSGLRPGDIAGRIGGDEFAVLLETVQAADEIDIRISSLKRYIEHPIDTRVGPITMQAAIGASVFSRDGECFEDLFEAADISMYQQKRHADTQLVE